MCRYCEKKEYVKINGKRHYVVHPRRKHQTQHRYSIYSHLRTPRLRPRSAMSLSR